MNELARKSELMKYVSPKMKRPLVHVDEQDMIILLNGMIVESAIEMYNIVTSGSSESFEPKSIDDEIENLDEDDFYDTVQEATISDKINAFKGILQARKYIGDSLAKNEEIDLKRQTKELDFGELNLE
jgi:hypothetical protein